MLVVVSHPVVLVGGNSHEFGLGEVKRSVVLRP